MIRIVTTEAERQEFVSERNWKFLREALGRKNVEFTIVGDCESFVPNANKDDIYIVQTRRRDVIDAIVNSGCRNTAETEETVLLTFDKEVVKANLDKFGVPQPKTCSIDDIKEGDAYFVKPLHGSNSLCVDEKCLCHTRGEIEAKIKEISSCGESYILEEFISGFDCTVGLIKNVFGEIEVYPMAVLLDGETGILTREKKMSEDEICEVINSPLLIDYARKAFEAVGCKHYMRIDFRMTESGIPYCIDFNLYPGLGPIDHFAKCLALNLHLGYYDVLQKIIATAD